MSNSHDADGQGLSYHLDTLSRRSPGIFVIPAQSGILVHMPCLHTPKSSLTRNVEHRLWRTTDII